MNEDKKALIIFLVPVLVLAFFIAGAVILREIKRAPDQVCFSAGSMSASCADKEKIRRLVRECFGRMTTEEIFDSKKREEIMKGCPSD